MVPDIAILTAFVESIERSLLYVFDIKNSNGIAGHTEASFAKINARNELIERDIVLMKYYSNSKYEAFSPDEIASALREFPLCVKYFKDHSLDVNFFKARSSFNTVTSVCVVSGVKASKPFGGNVTASTNSCAEHAIRKSFIECLPNVVHNLLSPSMRRISIEEFKKIKYFTPDDHHALMRDLDFGATAIEKFQFSDDCENVSDLNINLVSIDWNKEGKLKFLSDMELHFYRATSKDAQDLFFGVPSDSVINMKRLREYNRDLTEWNNQPHPLG